MFIRFDYDDRRPAYQQIADEIRELIARGELVEGDSLPPVRQLAGDLGINLNTVAAAYRGLQDEGLISIRHGVGAEVVSRKQMANNPAALRKSEDELRKSLRTVLAQLALAGMSRSNIMNLVTDELRGLFKGTK
ncbi:MAG: GntR family transcriptional regulator [Acidobacteria bacterium]|nr:GntR family transcriptional regulator [Acidobacteriota bacterium]